MKTLIVLLVAFPLCVLAQSGDKSFIKEIKKFQKELNADYKDPKKSPLLKEDLIKFKKHDFFPIDLKYRVNAKLTVTSATPFFKMKTTTSRLPEYRIYGYIEFSIGDKSFKLPVYQSQDLMKSKEYADNLFLPFTDLTNGVSTYDGGRYIELKIPTEGDSILVDFNTAYNPYCAYNHAYSCPIVPKENHMDIEVQAGVKLKK